MGSEDLKEFPTSPRAVDLDRLRRARAGRRVGLAALVGVLVLAGANLLGVRFGVVTSSGGGYRLSVAYAKVSRPGLSTPWSIEVQRSGGFDGPIRIATSRRYLTLFDYNAAHPEPSATTGTPDVVIWEFDPPPGDTLRVSFDGRLEPTEHLSQLGETSVLVDDVPVVTVAYTTRVVP
ncbi:MAG TPA: hypothetical protein VGR49_03720 [Actinomycetota bacterium]|jgi:hypothetical protein|nr:hypothetical protein [Actinomycetota bacterium]